MYKKPTLKLIKNHVVYKKNPSILFYELCKKRSFTLLLESADINKKKDLKSLLIIDSAIRITALDNKVRFKILSKNGKKLLSLMKNLIPDIIKIIFYKDGYELIFPTINHMQDEDSKLKSISVFDALRFVNQVVKSSKEEKMSVFLGGFFSYNLVDHFEPLLYVNLKKNCPDYCFYLAETLLIIDHRNKTSILQASLFVPSQSEEKRLKKRVNELTNIIEKSNISLYKIPTKKIKNMKLKAIPNKENFCRIIKEMQKEIILGEVFQVVPSQQFYLPCPSSLTAYNILKKKNPSPYMFFMQDKSFTLFGASPESSLKFNSSTRKIEIYPIAGTRPRGYSINGFINNDLDKRIELEMRIDKKELSEHLMLVDLARNDLSKICIPGSRFVEELLKVDRYSFVMHLVSRIVGTLRNDLDVLHAYRACMNMGTLTGAPKIRAMQLIAEKETKKRGSYGGAIGYLTSMGDLDTCIIIRSAYVKNDIATIQAGAGVVVNSNPEDETNESLNKARAVLYAIAKAHYCKDTF
ncbi:anthranilate synthase component 1 [Candidatus Tachikawaea gelatinosa]|nr:anthranilate synthase component 1 [Candidatus Tachikawaea gelatinosa]